MLVLTRKLGDKIQIGDNITITVVSVGGQRTRLAIDAPREVSVARSEILNDQGQRTTKPNGSSIHVG